MKFYIKTFGCQMNEADSERLVSVLKEKGYKKAPLEETDLIIINSCSVRQSAEDRVFGLNKKLKELKAKNEKLKTILTGCMNYHDLKVLKKKLWTVDEFLPIEEIFKKFGVNGDYLETVPKPDSSFSAYVPIMTGCNNFCAYCVVPYARGRERSRPWKKIICEITRLVKSGVKEIILLGQNVNSFKGGITFPELLKKIEKIGPEPLAPRKRGTRVQGENNFWIRFITSHPKDFSDGLIKVIKNSKKITPYIHLPAQSGSNKILKKMNRGYTREKYLNLIKKIRKEIPGVAISTDIIVGFPGESSEDFEGTVALFKKACFDMAYIARYSPRPKTAASKLKDSVSLKEKKKREKILTKILEKTALQNNKKYIGTTQKVLVEKKKNEAPRAKQKVPSDKEIYPSGFACGAESRTRGPIRSETESDVLLVRDGKYIGKTATFKNVLFSSDKKNLIGKFVLVKIKRAFPFGLEGSLK